MARQISSHRGVGDEFIAPQDVHGDLSSNNSNVAAGNSLISSGLKFGTIIFKDKYIVDMEKFTTARLSSMEFSNMISILAVVFYYFHALVSYPVVIHNRLSSI